MTPSRDHLLDIVGGMDGGVITCTKILQYVKEILCEEMNAHKQGKEVHEEARERTKAATHGKRKCHQLNTKFPPIVHGIYNTFYAIWITKRTYFIRC